MNSALVIDNGSATIKAGLVGDDGPRVALPTAIGYPNHLNTFNDFLVGFEAESKREILSLRYPIECGIISDWDGMEKIWNYVFTEELSINPSNHPILLSEYPFNPKINREKTAEIMFETFQSPAIYLQNQQVLSLYASGRTTGLVFDSGKNRSCAVPVYEGYSLPHAIRCLNLGGMDLTNYLATLLNERGYGFRFSSEIGLVRDIKEKLCFVARDNTLESNICVEKIYELPDGQVIELGKERFCCPEALFKPALINLPLSGVDDLIYSSITKCNIDIRREMYGAIVLSGGSTMFTGFSERMKKTLCKISSPSTRIRVISPPERKYASWIGGSILASIPTFQQMYVTKAEYEEAGPTIIHKRCI